MKFPWDKELPYYEEEKPKRARETLAQTAEKIIQKKMKSDPEYGIEAAEKIKNMRHEDKSLMAQLKELKTLKEALGDFGEGKDKSIIVTILESISVIPALLQVLWADTTHDEGDTTEEDAIKLEPSPVVTYGKLLVDNDGKVVIACTEFFDDKKELRDIIAIPKCCVRSVVQLEEVSQMWKPILEQAWG